MFTGIIQEIGTVIALHRIGGGIRVTVSAPAAVGELNVSDSVSVSGACQTIVSMAGRNFTVESVEETLRKTTFGDLRVSSRVNIELPVRLNDRLGGHLVQGHVDCVGTVRSVVKQESSWLVGIGFPGEFGRYLVPAGSIAVDGVSLTVARLEGETFSISIIPHTLSKTTLADLAPGSRVNLEFDLLGKYVERLLRGDPAGEKSGSITSERLRDWGYKG